MQGAEPTSVVQAADFTESCACKRNSLRAGHVQVQQLASMRLYSGKVCSQCGGRLVSFFVLACMASIVSNLNVTMHVLSLGDFFN